MVMCNYATIDLLAAAIRTFLFCSEVIIMVPRGKSYLPIDFWLGWQRHSLKKDAVSSLFLVYAYHNLYRLVVIAFSQC